VTDRAIQGKNVLVRAKKDGSYVEWVCATSVEFYFDSELDEITTADSPNMKEFELGIGEWGFTLNTVSVAAPSTVAYTVFDSILESLRKNGLDVEISFEDDLGNVKAITGYALIPHTGINANVVGFSEDDIEFKGSGAFAISEVLVTPVDELDEPEVIEITDSIIPVDGTTGNVPQLIGLTKDDVIYERDGIGKEVIDSGTPTDKQVLIDFTTGNITLPYPKYTDEWHQIILI